MADAAERFLAFNRAEAARLEAQYRECRREREMAARRLADARNQVAAAYALVMERAAATRDASAIARARAYTEEVQRECELEETSDPSRPRRRRRPHLQNRLTNNAAAASPPHNVSPQPCSYVEQALRGKYHESPAIGCAPVIARAYTHFHKRFEAARQSFIGPSTRAVLYRMDADVSSPATSFPVGSYVWIVYRLDRNLGLWRPLVRPPRRDTTAGRIGVLATRSPHRPNGIGISLARVIAPPADACLGSDASPWLHLEGCDLLNDTPVLAVQSYDVAQEDWPEARAGWTADAQHTRRLWYDRADTVATVYQVQLAEARVRRRMEWLAVHAGLTDLPARLSILSDPRQWRTATEDGMDGAATAARESERSPSGVLSIGAYRVSYRVDHPTRTVHIDDIVSGMRAEVLQDPREVATDPEVRQHRQFIAAFEE
ncbi:hypothetical protein CDCA_CDCA17G4383 [Cyanidium caldarium]|uniref:TsaA-like domain-containing protein n=1 Tax=Cyanidium caldarium TaxID=2771 RepID=A0AAV9J1Y1_CYACA|nr:hypothetical protein CDCA_CDCA17G4383 [Cyanidium caldarium]